MTTPRDKKAGEILGLIVEDYRRAKSAEQEFIRWESAHRKDGDCDEFAERFYAWLDASEPFVARKSLVEEQFPEFVYDMTKKLDAVH